MHWRRTWISGLGLGVLVVEAPEKSGALITASRALDQGRDVFAVPANVDVYSCRGNLKLLREGAIVARDAWDVLQEYAPMYPGQLHHASAISFVQEKKMPPPEPELPQTTSSMDGSIPFSTFAVSLASRPYSSAVL